MGNRTLGLYREKMPALKRWYLPVSIFFATCFGVFVLPFLLPPPYLPIVSASNAAGFNNKISALVAALLGVSAFFLFLRSPRLEAHPASGDYRPLSGRLVAIAVSLFGLFYAAFSYLIVRSELRYSNDSGYFIHQISMWTDYGRRLYDQIEFPYGPLLFYGPVLMRALLSPFRISLTTAYFITLVLEHVIGLLLLAWIINSLPLLRKWKTLIFLLGALNAVVPNFGLNYTLFRYILPAAFIVFASKQRGPLKVAAALLAGQVVCMAVSPEMGFAFGAASVAYAGWYFFTEGASWLIAVASPFVAVAIFLLIVGESYLRMLKLFSKGLYNFIVEPLTHILLFLFAVVWLIPALLAMLFRQSRQEFPLFAALYVVALGLMPVAFGRADPAHVFLNGIPIYLLSLVAISYIRPRQQTAWAVCVAAVLVWTAWVTIKPFRYPVEAVVVTDLFYPRSGGVNPKTIALLRKIRPSSAERRLKFRPAHYDPFDSDKLHAFVGNATVAIPHEVPLVVEDALKRSGHYQPSFYFFHIAVIDATAETRMVEELNASQWALLPPGDTALLQYETPETTGNLVGFRLPYHSRRPPYIAGKLFESNLKTHWQPYAEISTYQLYKRR